MRNLALFVLALAASACAAAQALDPARSSITVVSRQMNVPVEGKFMRLGGRIAFDPAKPETSAAEITIDMASFDIGNAEVNDEAKGRNWFDVKGFPQAKFVASQVKTAGAGRYEVTGPLTIKGKTHTVTAPFTVKTGGGGALYEGTFSIRRLAFGVGEGVWKDTDTVADEVQIHFRLVTAGGPSTGAAAR